MDEIWTIIKVTSKTIWEISDQGNVRKNREIVIFDDTIEGYYKLAIGSIHRLVALVYVPNPENKPQVDHIDGNKHNNAASNLRWVTASENMLNPVTRAKRSKIMKGKTPWNAGKVGVQVAWNKGIHTGIEPANKGIHTGIAPGNKGKIAIHLINKIKYVEEDYLDYWLDDGWLLGTGTCVASCKNKHRVYDNKEHTKYHYVPNN